MIKSDIDLLNQLSPVNVSTSMLDKISSKINHRKHDRISQTTFYSLSVVVILLIALNGYSIYKSVQHKSTLENNIVYSMNLIDDNTLYK